MCLRLWLVSVLSLLNCIHSINGAAWNHQFNARRTVDETPETSSLHIRSIIKNRLAKTLVTSTVYNPAAKSQNVDFNYILPNKAYITSFTILPANGGLEEAVVLGKQSARRFATHYPTGVLDSRLIEQARDSKAFSVTTPIPATTNVTFALKYIELLERDRGSYENILLLVTKSPIPDLKVVVDIREQQAIKDVFLPSIGPLNAASNPEQKTNPEPLATINHSKPKHATVTFKPSLKEQKDLAIKLRSSPGVIGRLAVSYNLDHQSTDGDCGELLADDQHFAHFYTSDNSVPLKKHVVFVLDMSGSMQGRKLRQVKSAISTILDQLLPEDTFSLIIFDHVVFSVNIFDKNQNIPQYGSCGKTYPLPQKPLWHYQATPENIKAAKTAVHNLTASGWTNIYDALRMGFKAVRDVQGLPSDTTDQPHPEPIIIFLTDGVPQAGPSIKTKDIIAVAAKENENPKTLLFTLGFGMDPDMELLKELSVATGASEKKIYDATDASTQLVNFFHSISTPVLAQIKFKYNLGQIAGDSLTITKFPMLTKGKEVVVAGKVKPDEQLSAEISGDGRNTKKKCTVYAVDVKKDEENLQNAKNSGANESLSINSTSQSPQDTESSKDTVKDSCLNPDFIQTIGNGNADSKTSISGSNSSSDSNSIFSSNATASGNELDKTQEGDSLKEVWLTLVVKQLENLLTNEEAGVNTENLKGNNISLSQILPNPESIKLINDSEHTNSSDQVPNKRLEDIALHYHLVTAASELVIRLTNGEVQIVRPYAVNPDDDSQSRRSASGKPEFPYPEMPFLRKDTQLIGDDFFLDLEGSGLYRLGTPPPNSTTTEAANCELKDSYSEGVCQYISDCPTSDALRNRRSYYESFCSRDEYAGVCCNADEVATTTLASTNVL